MANEDFYKTFKESIFNVKRRPFDRFFLGPFLIWYAVRTKKMPKLARTMLVSAGIYQVIYSKDDYQKVIVPIKSGDIQRTYEVVTNSGGIQDAIGLISNSNF